MFCPHCGVQIRDNLSSCPRCDIDLVDKELDNSEKISKISRILGLLDEQSKGKDWLVEEMKKAKLKLDIDKNSNSYEILKSCPMVLFHIYLGY